MSNSKPDKQLIICYSARGKFVEMTSPAKKKKDKKKKLTSWNLRSYAQVRMFS
jgi:hypothetical protein